MNNYYNYTITLKNIIGIVIYQENIIAKNENDAIKKLFNEYDIIMNIGDTLTIDETE